jgi:hypothetical protein
VQGQTVIVGGITDVGQNYSTATYIMDWNLQNNPLLKWQQGPDMGNLNTGTQTGPRCVTNLISSKIMIAGLRAGTFGSRTQVWSLNTQDFNHSKWTFGKENFDLAAAAGGHNFGWLHGPNQLAASVDKADSLAIDMQSGTWGRGPTDPSPDNQFCGAGFVGEQFPKQGVIRVGGTEQSRAGANDTVNVWQYDAGTQPRGVWHPLPSYPLRITELACAVDNQGYFPARIYCFGGVDSSSVITDAVYSAEISSTPGTTGTTGTTTGTTTGATTGAAATTGTTTGSTTGVATTTGTTTDASTKESTASHSFVAATVWLAASVGAISFL